VLEKEEGRCPKSALHLGIGPRASGQLHGRGEREGQIPGAISKHIPITPFIATFLQLQCVGLVTCRVDFILQDHWSLTMAGPNTDNWATSQATLTP
jgi:hypothetical protein